VAQTCSVTTRQLTEQESYSKTSEDTENLEASTITKLENFGLENSQGQCDVTWWSR